MRARRQYLEIHNFTSSTDDYGQPVNAYSPVMDGANPLRIAVGMKRIKDEQLTNQAIAKRTGALYEIETRWHPEINIKTRLVWPDSPAGSRSFEVSDLEDVGELRRNLKIKAREVNDA